MSKAEEILAERLARGEISIDDFELLSSKLRATPTPLADPLKSVQSAGLDAVKRASGINPKWIKWGGVALGVFVVVSCISGMAADRVDITSLKASGFLGDYVSGALYTEGSSGPVYLWVEMGGKVMCPKKIYVASKQEKAFEFRCVQMELDGKFKVFTDRSPSDWVKENAGSL